MSIQRRPGRLAPSILAADFSRLGDQLAEIEQTGLVDRIHVDVMDGAFVPSISFGGPIAAAVRRSTTTPMDVHLMVVDPSRFFQEFAEHGARWISIHVEACPHLHRDIDAIRRLGVRPGVAINPGTSLTALDAILPDVDVVLLMTVDPGWGGQPFIPGSVGRIAALRETLESRGLGHVEIEVDGGIKVENLPGARDAGADVFVVGSGVFSHPAGISAAISQLVGLTGQSGRLDR
ncbi:MAG TPA: ribulose-phosphate 3-epimerase [Chloroflexota bacterium]|nr:ribulose-phosphate 3-epimerase [Chloroflexota bacterium]